MDTAFVMLAHRNPGQIARLCDRLSPARVVLHLDPSGAAVPPDTLPANVTLIPGRPLSWAGWTQVEATLRGFEEALGGGPEFIVTLSGQDYPLRPVAAIDAFLAEHRSSFISTFTLPFEYWGRFGGLDRAHLVNLTWRGRERIPLPIPRRLPLGMRAYGGSAFFCIRADAARHVCDLVRERPRIARFFKHTWLPIELFVPTVVANSPYAEQNINESLWHIEWPADRGSHPEVLTTAALERLRRSAAGPSTVNGPARVKLFARKFDADVDAAVLDRIDELLLS